MLYEYIGIGIRYPQAYPNKVLLLPGYISSVITFLLPGNKTSITMELSNVNKCYNCYNNVYSYIVISLCVQNIVALLFIIDSIYVPHIYGLALSHGNIQ